MGGDDSLLFVVVMASWAPCWVSVTVSVTGDEIVVWLGVVESKCVNSENCSFVECCSVPVDSSVVELSVASLASVNVIVPSSVEYVVVEVFDTGGADETSIDVFYAVS